METNFNKMSKLSLLSMFFYGQIMNCELIEIFSFDSIDNCQPPTTISNSMISENPVLTNTTDFETGIASGLIKP